MSDLIDEAIASKFAEYVPDGQSIVLAQNVKLKSNPILWILCIITSVFLVGSALEVAGITNFSQDFGNHRHNPWLSLAISANGFLITSSLILRGRSTEVVVTNHAFVIANSGDIGPEKIISIELKAPKHLLLHWSQSDADFTQAPFRLTFDDLDAVARKLSDLIQVPVSQSNGFVSKTVYQPNRS